MPQPSGIQQQVGTTFTVNGIQNAIQQVRRFVEGVGSFMRSVASGSRDFFAPIMSGLKKIANFSFSSLRRGAEFEFNAIKKAADVSFSAVRKSAEFGFSAMKTAAKAAFIGIAGYAVLAALKIKTMATAALESSKQIGDMLGKISDNRRRTGLSAEDISTLQYAMGREGVDPEQMLPALSKIGNQFATIKDKIAQANAEYEKTKMWNLAKLRVDGTTPDNVMATLSANSAAASTSFSGIQDQQAIIRQQLDWTAGFNESDDATRNAVGQYRIQLVEQYKALQTAQQQLVQSMGPVGIALDILNKKAGIDMRAAMGGGMESIYAIADAFQRLQDPTEKLRVAMSLFGEDQGARMITVLDRGREGIMEYRKELERLGGVVTKADADLGDDYGDSIDKLNQAFKGLKLSLAREILPMIIQSQDQLREWIVTNRAWLVGVMKDAFVSVRNLMSDVISMFQGQRSGYATGWLNSIAKYLWWMFDLVGKIGHEISLVFENKKTDWPWLNVTVSALKYVGKLAYELGIEIEKLWDGKKSEWPWLNAVANGLKNIKLFAIDVYNVLIGKQAKSYEWLNSAEQKFKDFIKKAEFFGEKFVAALKIFIDVLQKVREGVEWVIKTFTNFDPTVTTMLIGIASITGALGTLLTIGGKIISMFGAIGTAAAAASAGGAASTAAAAAAASGVASTAAGAAGTAGTVAGGGMLAAAAPIVGALALGGAIGYAGYSYLDAKDRAIQDKTTDLVGETVKYQGDASYDERYNRLMNSTGPQRDLFGTYEQNRLARAGDQVYTYKQTPSEMLDNGPYTYDPYKREFVQNKLEAQTSMSPEKYNEQMRQYLDALVGPDRAHYIIELDNKKGKFVGNDDVIEILKNVVNLQRY